MKDIRGQVAMEYLATYGWAIFAIFIVLALLFGSGIFNPSRFTSEECSFSPNLPCGSFYLAKVNGNELMLSFNLTNAMGFPIYIDNVSYRLDTESAAHLCTPSTGCGLYLGQGRTTNDGAGQTPWTLSFGPQPSKITADLRRVYLNVTFRNCQDLPEYAGAGPAPLGTCNYPGTAPDYPWHVVSGRMVAVVRNA